MTTDPRDAPPGRRAPAGIRLLVFDWDGTLMDSEPQIVACLHAAMRELALDPLDDDTVKNVIGLGLREAIEALVPGRDSGFHDAFVAHYRRHWFRSDMSPLFGGVHELLALCRRHRLLLGIATGKSRRGLDRALAENRLEAMFDATRCADEAPSKPHPQMLEDVMRRVGVDPGHTIMVGDTEYDMEMATSAGTGKVAVTSGVHSAERLARHEPLASLGSVAELADWLRRTGILPAAT